jgi:peptidoglycan/LPS O-acetylase OafA/YrhL
VPLPALTGVRFFAAMQVTMFHFGAGFAQRHGAPRIVENLLKNGWTAVTLFFILSGFILSYTYSGQIEKPGGKIASGRRALHVFIPCICLLSFCRCRFAATPARV